ncbi:hypothetical protein DFH06DRAFT_182474 [Mycena polygramma]|nr:hypothetical protein DFH06DRAFT_182474 [Mycena polygramma]
MRKRLKDYENICLPFPPGSPAHDEPLPMDLKLGLIFNAQLPDLFKFCFFVWKDDVPEDILDDCIWALGLFIRTREECSENVLVAAGHVQGNGAYKLARYLTVMNARQKIASYLRRADRAQEAVAYIKAMVDEDCSRGDEMWLQKPTLFELYGETLVLARSDDHEAVKVLRQAMLGFESVDWSKSDMDGLPQLVKTRIFLSRALRNVALDEEATTHEAWLITWFRKNPYMLHDGDLRFLLLPPGPILQGLGGEAWLENRKSTSKADRRLTKACRTCGAREPLVTLQRCNNCKYIYYCSKECQKSHWKHHKVECREMVAIQEQIESMSLTDPDGAKLATDWSSWCDSNPDDFWMIHALGFHRDLKRGRTHIVIKMIEHVPTATKLKNKFRVALCGVFLIKDVIRDVEGIMNLNRDEGQEYVDGLFYELAGAHADVPFIHLAFCDGVTAWICTGATYLNSIQAAP